VIDKDGAQQALFPYNDPGQLPITPLRRPNGEWLRLEVALPGYSVWLRVWQVKVGRVKLYLLDSNDAANYPAHRGITSELYGGGPELRLKQELLLGIGGWQLLATVGIKPEVCHLNEGHAAFAVLERARSFQGGQSFHHAHRGGRRLRPFLSGAHRAISRSLRTDAGRHNLPRFAGVGPPGTRQAHGESLEQLAPVRSSPSPRAMSAIERSATRSMR
jgi:alpha-glucan phosphorylase-like protein